MNCCHEVYVFTECILVCRYQAVTGRPNEELHVDWLPAEPPGTRWGCYMRISFIFCSSQPATHVSLAAAVSSVLGGRTLTVYFIIMFLFVLVRKVKCCPLGHVFGQEQNEHGSVCLVFGLKPTVTLKHWQKTHKFSMCTCKLMDMKMFNKLL